MDRSQANCPATTSVILLAAGHGTRMRPLTSNTPKPLLRVGDHALIEHHLYRLAEQGFQHIVINTAYLGTHIHRALGDGQRYGLEIQYSDESDTGALETAGGIKKSLDLLRSESFIAINADIYTDFDFASLVSLEAQELGYLVVVNNPEHNPNGDFGIDHNGKFVSEPSSAEKSMTFSGIAYYQKELFRQLPEGKIALGPILKTLIKQRQLAALPFLGSWTDVGTPERLAQLNNAL